MRLTRSVIRFKFMKIFRTLVLTIFGISILAALVVSYLGYTILAKAVGTPALMIVAWVAIGHFVTLDDDMPGEWSNPEGNKKIWYSSLLELLVKVIVLVIVVYLIYV